MINQEQLTKALKQAVSELFDEELISQIDSCIRKIVAEEVAKIIKK